MSLILIAANYALHAPKRVKKLVLLGSMGYDSTNTAPQPSPPTSFIPAQLQQIQVPVLTFFGTKDTVIGDADKTKALAENIPDVRVEIVESGHLIGAELPDIVNPAMLEFFNEYAH